MKTVRARKRGNNEVTDEVREQAMERGRERARSEPHAVAVHYLAERNAIELDFGDSTAVMLPVANYPELRALTKEELQRLTLGFDGSILCLEEHDLDISIAGLVAASDPLTALATAVVAVDAGEIKAWSGVGGDDLQNRGTQDRTRINLHEQWEVQYWTKTLGVSEEELRRAVQEANTIRKARREAGDDDDPARSYVRA
jgi:hypothetical protein